MVGDLVAMETKTAVKIVYIFRKQTMAKLITVAHCMSEKKVEKWLYSGL